MEYIGVEVEASRPADGPGHGVDAHGGEGVVGVERSQNAGEGQGHVELSDEIVGEGDAQGSAIDHLDLAHPSKLSHEDSLLKWLDRAERGWFLGNPVELAQAGHTGNATTGSDARTLPGKPVRHRSPGGTDGRSRVGGRNALVGWKMVGTVPALPPHAHLSGTGHQPGPAGWAIR